MDRHHDCWTIDDIRLFAGYCDRINAADLKVTTKMTYITHANRFVRWLAGEVDL